MWKPDKYCSSEEIKVNIYNVKSFWSYVHVIYCNEKAWSSFQKPITPFWKNQTNAKGNLKKKNQCFCKMLQKNSNELLGQPNILKTLVSLDAKSGNQGYGSCIHFISIFFVIGSWTVQSPTVISYGNFGIFFYSMLDIYF